MTTFNTGNPVGSVDPRDLYDNAENLDVLVNHPTKNEFPDRLGKPRKTWHGMEQDFQQFLVNSGYTGTGAGGAYEDYDTDGPLTIDALNQVFIKDGEFYRLKPNQDLPYTTTTWGADETNMVAVGDAALRQQLSGAQGAELIGFEDSSVYSELQRLSDAVLMEDLSSTNGASFVGTKDEGPLQDYINRQRSMDAKAANAFSQKITAFEGGNAWGMKHAVVLGDSISHGASSLDIFNNAWVSKLRRCLNWSNNSNNWGFVSIDDKIGSAAGINQELHEVSLGSGWTQKNNADAGHTINGAFAVTSTNGSIITITLKPQAKFYRVWYTRLVGGGTFVVRSGGVQDLNIDSSLNATGKEGWFWTYAEQLRPDHNGVCTIEIESTSANEVQILGVSYANDFNDLILDNFSQAGRKLIQVDDIVLEKAISGASPFIFALGHNDKDGSEAENQAFTQKINKIIETANLQKVKVIICDFAWHKDKDNHVRSELLRASIEIPLSVYLPFPDYIKNGGIADSSYTINEIGFLSDSSHPTPYGHEVLSTAIISAAGLSGYEFGSKLDKSFSPFKVEDTGLENAIPDRYEYYSGYRIGLDSVSVRARIKKPGGGAIAPGTYHLGSISDGVFVPYTMSFPIYDASSSDADDLANKLALVKVGSGSNAVVSVSVPTGYVGSVISFQFDIPYSKPF